VRDIPSAVGRIVSEARMVDFHTHLFTPCHGAICWWGIDDLLNYHYLISEAFRYLTLPPEKFWELTKAQQADLIWKTLFADRTPISEAARGVVTCLSRLGADPNTRDLNKIRNFYRQFTLEKFIDRIFALAKIDYLYMTNDPLDPDERQVWQRGHIEDPRFRKALRVDNFFRNAGFSQATLKADGFPVEKSLNPKSLKNLRKFFEKWCDIIQPEYFAASLPPDFAYPSKTNPYAKMIGQVVLPIARERRLPLALMIGVRRLVNPSLKSAGDSIGRADICAVENLCLENPDIRFFCTMLSRENQHELCVTSRKFRNLTLFGCWWFVNNPSLIEEITRMRLEILGLSFIPQHSDCRVIDQLLYKWDHSKTVLSKVFAEKYAGLAESGYEITEERIRADVKSLLSENVKQGLKC
jgi:hypothetical protein